MPYSAFATSRPLRPFHPISGKVDTKRTQNGVDTVTRHTRKGRQGVDTKRFSASIVSALPAGTHTDPAQTGLQLRVRATQHGTSRTWLLRCKFQGDETRIALGHFPATSLDAARGIARQLREQAAKGIDPRRAFQRRIARPAPLPGSATIARAADRHTVEFLASEFVERHVKPNRKRPEYVQAQLTKDVLPQWKGRDARTITPREIIELLDGLVDRGAPVAANRLAGTLGQLFKFGVHRAIVDSSPVQLLFRPGGKERPRERALSDDELQAFLADPQACCRYARLQHVITVLLATGQRRGELALARWRDIDLDEKTWAIPPEHSKNGKAHLVPLSAFAVDEFRGLKTLSASQWVLPNGRGDGPIDAKLLTRGVAKCQQRFSKAGIAPFALHDLRRTCRTGLARLKVAPHVAERVLNHAQERIASTYDLHDYLDEKRAALDLWGAWLRGLSRG